MKTIAWDIRDRFMNIAMLNIELCKTVSHGPRKVTPQNSFSDISTLNTTEIEKEVNAIS